MRKLICMDHLGNQYKSERKMCSVYKVRIDTFCQRKKRGWSLEEALTGKREKVQDHLGNRYVTKEAMCREYGVSVPSFNYRIAKGLPLEEALTLKRLSNNTRDHLGNCYVNEREMCEAYGVKHCTYRKRIQAGCTLKEALCGRKSRSKRGEVCRDHHGNLYTSKLAMCSAYKISYYAYQRRISRGYSLEEALTIPYYGRRESCGKVCCESCGNT